MFGPLLLKRTLVVQFSQEANTRKQPLNLIIWLFYFGTFNCSTSHLISHIKNGSACFIKISLPIFHAIKTNPFSRDTNKDPLDFGWFKVHVSSHLSESILIRCSCGTKAYISEQSWATAKSAAPINFIRGISARKPVSFQLDFITVSDECGSVINNYLQLSPS